MRKLLIALCLILAGSAAQSQVLISILLGDKLNSPDLEFGLEGGFNYTHINGFEASDYLRNFNLGFYFDIRMKDQLYLYSGVQVKSSYGMKNLSENDVEFLQAQIVDVDGKYSQKVNCFMVPVLANYKFKNHFYVEAGPQLGLAYNSWIEFTSNADNRDIKIKDYNDEMLNWFNAGITAGIGYKLMKGEGWMIGIRYYQGLTDVFKDKSGSIQNSLNFKVNIPIGAGKPTSEN